MLETRSQNAEPRVPEAPQSSARHQSAPGSLLKVSAAMTAALLFGGCDEHYLIVAVNEDLAYVDAGPDTDDAPNERARLALAVRSYCESAYACTDEFEVGADQLDADTMIASCFEGVYSELLGDYDLAPLADDHLCFAATANAFRCIEVALCGNESEDCGSAHQAQADACVPALNTTTR